MDFENVTSHVCIVNAALQRSTDVEGVCGTGAVPLLNSAQTRPLARYYYIPSLPRCVQSKTCLNLCCKTPHTEWDAYDSLMLPFLYSFRDISRLTNQSFQLATRLSRSCDTHSCCNGHP